MTEKEMGFDEVMAALPAYAAKILNVEKRTAVEIYLQRQIALFQRLDELEEAAGVVEGPTGNRSRGRRSLADEEPFAQVMEGWTGNQQMPDNPLLMRKSPRTYTDSRTGQRFVIPRRGTLHPDSAPRSFPSIDPSWRVRTGRTLWNLLALAAVVAVLIICANQLYLQRQLTATQEQLAIAAAANRRILLHDTTAASAMSGTLFLANQRALLMLSPLQPLPDGQVYQLWLTASDSRQVSADLLTASTITAQQLLFDLPLDAATITRAGFSIEPAGGSPQPTGAMVLDGQSDIE